MALRDMLVERGAAIRSRWLDAVLAEYGPATAARWRAERDPFANPVGHALAAGLPELYASAVAAEAALGEPAVAALEAILRIRSVQGLGPSRAVGFVLLLRRAVRDELAAELARDDLAADLAALDARIEALELAAFDAYVSLREEMFRLRQEELKRSVAAILRRWHGGDVPDAAAEDLVKLGRPPAPVERR